jgi:mRNA interferase RelE/StbE
VARYRVELLDRKTQRQLDRIHEPDFSRVAEAILKLEENPRPQGCRKLRGLEGWRVRVGSWRVIYHINDLEQVVTIVEIRRRREDTCRPIR